MLDIYANIKYYIN